VAIANSRLAPATEDGVALADGAAEAGPFGKADPAAARDGLGGAPLSVRIGYQGPNARLAVTVGAITTSCSAAGINVTNVTLDSSGPQALRTERSMRCWPAPVERPAAVEWIVGDGCLRPAHRQRKQPAQLHKWPGRRHNRHAGGIRRPRRACRLLAQGAPILWADMPTLPLYRQQRTLLMSRRCMP